MKGTIYTAVIFMGFSGITAEILLLRELLIIFAGNELSIGIILANWLILESFGCFFLGKLAQRSKNRLTIFSIVTLLFSFSLPLSIFFIRVLRDFLGVSIGQIIGFIPMFFSSFLVLLPVSVFHGALFTLSCGILSSYSDRRIFAGRVYVLETAGTVIGGIFCTFLIIPYFSSLTVFLFLALGNITICFILALLHKNKGFKKFMGLIGLGILMTFFSYLFLSSNMNKLDDYLLDRQWGRHNIIHYQNSNYGNICIIENEGQYTYFLDGIPALIVPVPDIPFIEVFVHVPMLAHPDPSEILILSGGAGGIINEALKHPGVEDIEYAELDPLLLSLLAKYPTAVTSRELKDSRVRTRHIDGRLYLQTTRGKYDIIMMGIAEPSNLQSNRYFTKEFFTLAKKRLKERGIIVFALPGSLTLLNEELKDLNSCIYHTLQSVFPHIRVIPGDSTNLFLASETDDIKMIDINMVIKRLNERNVTEELMVPWHIERKLHHGWQEWFSGFIDGGSRNLNLDFKPLGLYYNISHWNALYSPYFGRIFRHFSKLRLYMVFIVFISFLMTFYIFRPGFKPFINQAVPFSIITTGFAGIIYSLIIIFAFQSMYGHVFSWIGLLIAAYMAGSAAGAMFVNRSIDTIGAGFYKILEIALICMSLLLPIIVLVLNKFDYSQTLFLFRGVFTFLSFACGLISGAQFPLANKLYSAQKRCHIQTGGTIYASDLLGGWFGGIAGAVVLLPVIGIFGTCIAVAMLKVISLLFVFTVHE